MTVVPRTEAAATFFQPSVGFVGDVIPFVHGGRFHLFYLHEIRENAGSGTAWGLVVTDDFVVFEDLGPVLASGGPHAADFNAYTGSVIADGERLHMFYTGHNPARIGPDGVTPLQVVMHAVSGGDPSRWEKVPTDTFGAPEGYEPGDWRDPYVFRVPGEDQWRMVLAARHDRGPSRRRGVIAQLRSSDLSTWQVVQPFWDPRRYITHECPDVFEWNGWWYLVYSEFSESFTARYRIARSPEGPWSVPERDTIDGRAFYAAKSVERDGRRFFVGWIATREGDVDDGPWQWAGTMSVLEAQQADDGTLRFRMPPEVLRPFNEPLATSWHDAMSGRSLTEDELAAGTPNGYWAAVSDAAMPSAFALRVDLELSEDTRECGVLLRSSSDGDTSYIIRLEPHRHRVVFDRWPRRRTGAMQWQISGDVPHVVELERSCPLPAGPHHLDVVVDDTACVVTVDESVVLSTRLYDRRAGHLGLFVGEGRATFGNPTVSVRSETTRKEAQ